MSGFASSQPANRLMNRDFVLLWQGQLVSQMGSQAFSIAMMFWTMEATGSASLMGLLMLLGSLPGVVFGPVAGTLADRVSRKHILVVCDALSGFAMLALTVAFFVEELSQELQIAGLLATALAVGVLQAFFRPASIAAIPDLVPEARVAAANSLSQGSFQLSVVLGQSLGGVLYGWIGAPLLFLINGASYLFSAASESFIRLPRPEPRSEPSGSVWARFWQDLVEGLRYVKRTGGMSEFLLLAAIVNFFAMPILVMLPFLVSQGLGRGADWYGFLLAGFGGGALAGYTFAGALPLSPRVRSVVLLASLVTTGTTLATLGLVNTAWVALALMTLVGALNGFFNIVVMTAFQLSTPGELRGRVMALVLTVAMAVSPLGMALGGILGDLTDKNIPLIYGLCGGLIAASTIVLGVRRPVRAFLAFDESGD